MLDLVHLKKYHTDASDYQQLFMEIRDRYHDYIPVYTDGSRDGYSVDCATVFPSNTVISMRLPDTASVFTAEVWPIILPKTTLCCVGYPAILALGAIKRQTLLPSQHWICLMPRLAYPIMILNIV